MRTPTAASLVVSLLLLGPGPGCSKEEPRDESTPAASSSVERREGGGPPAAAGAGESAVPRPVDPDALGTIHGVVSFSGEPPRRRPIGMGQDPACRHETEQLTENVVVVDGRLVGAFVYLKKGAERWLPPAAPEEPVVLDQKGCVYTPHVLALQTGQRLLVRNSDATTHNVNMQAKRNGLTGNHTMGQGQADLEFDFQRREHSIPFKCDIHPWMGAWVHVQDHPWFAVSDEDGAFEITGVPAGSYTLEAIHEELGKERVEVEVVAGATSEVELTYSE